LPPLKLQVHSTLNEMKLERGQDALPYLRLSTLSNTLKIDGCVLYLDSLTGSALRSLSGLISAKAAHDLWRIECVVVH